MRFGYIRVSTAEQSTARQDEVFNNLQLDRIFIDRLSGKDRDRPELELLMQFTRSGDEIYVKSIDRLGRNYRDVSAIVNQLNDKGVIVHFIKENIHLSGKNDDLVSKLTFSILGHIAEGELAWMRERSLEGIAIAKLIPGKYPGRKPKLQHIKEIELTERMANGENVTHLAREFGITRAACYKIRDRVVAK